MILGQLGPYLRRKDEFGAAESWGAFVAHHDLVAAALRFAATESAMFFLDPASESSMAEAQLAFRELEEEFRGRVFRRSIFDLPAAISSNPTVFVTTTDAFAPLAQMRQGAQTPFPICTIVHSIPPPCFFIHYVGAMLFSHPYDAILLTSRAGRASVEAAFESLRDFIGRAWKVPSVSLPRLVDSPLGVDHEFLAPRDRAASREELKLPGKATIILYLGRLSPTTKADLEPLIRTAARLARRQKDIFLVICGKDSQEQYASALRSQLESCGLANNSTIITNFAYSKKPALYSAADIFVSPIDNIQETFGLSILEAMAAGLPVVASDWSGYRDLIVDDQTGFLIPTFYNAELATFLSPLAPLSAQISLETEMARATVVDQAALEQRLEQLASNPGLRRRFGEAGRARIVERFSWRKVIKGLGDLWADQLERLGAVSKEARPRLNADLNHLYGHFATAPLANEAVVRRTDSGNALLEQLGQVAPGPSLEDRRREAVCDILQRCCGPTKVTFSGSDHNIITTGALTWLLKKGHIELIPD